MDRLKLKWPNDLLLDGAKLAGILIEAESAGGKTSIAAGIGVNCAHHPDGLAYWTTNLTARGAAATSDTLMTELSRTMRVRLAQWDRGAGFAAIRAEWLSHAAGIGSDIRVRLLDRELTGTFETLDAAGRLMLRLPGGALESITAGDVFPFLCPPLKGEGQREAPGRGHIEVTPTRRASPVDLPLSGGGERNF
jgi:BirA family biotin operon repressor/biotin-[acetyl-CoA-carboxylase] ligase